MKTIWNKQTGEALSYESVDAGEILKNSPDLYTDQDPHGDDPKNPDGDGREGAPQNVANVESEFRREPVGDDPPAKEREQVIIRNPVSDTPRMALAAGSAEAKALERDGNVDTAEMAQMRRQFDTSFSEQGAKLQADLRRVFQEAPDQQSRCPGSDGVVDQRCCGDGDIEWGDAP